MLELAYVFYVLGFLFLIAGMAYVLYLLIIRRFLGRVQYSEAVIHSKLQLFLPLVTIGAVLIALGGNLSSSHYSEQNLKQSLELQLMSHRPYLFVANVDIDIGDATPSDRDRPCQLIIKIRNGGALPATNLSVFPWMEFETRIEGHFARPWGDWPPKDPDVDGMLSVSAGQDIVHEVAIPVLIDQQDAIRIASGTPVFVQVRLLYSAPGIDRKWKYDIAGVLVKGQSFRRLREVL